MDAEIYLTLLPAEVLDLIFQQLNFHDKLQLAQTDPLLGQAFAVHSRSEFVDIDIRKLSAMYWPVILPLCGSLVRHINGTWDSQNYIPFHIIESQCPFLESIKFNVNTENWMQITSLLLNVKTLNSVHLHIAADCDPSVNLINALMQLPSLSKLLLHGFSCDMVYQLQNLFNLKDISLNLRSHPQAINIFEILSSLKNLRTLHISNMNIMETQNSCFNELQELEIFSCHIYSMLPMVPKLKSLRFRRNFNYSPDFRLFYWISQHSYTLEFLELLLPHLQHTNVHFGEQDLLEMLQNCTNLRTLHLGNSITWHFVGSFMNLLSAKGFSSERQFRFVL
ncbi:hypothetical protein KR059_006540, partial [Drosophila kikkawai]